MDGGGDRVETNKDEKPSYLPEFQPVKEGFLNEATKSMASGSPMWASPSWGGAHNVFSNIATGNYYGTEKDNFLKALQGYSGLIDQDKLAQLRGEFGRSYGGNPTSSDRYGIAAADYLTKSGAADKLRMADLTMSDEKNQLAALSQLMGEPYQVGNQLYNLLLAGRGSQVTGTQNTTSEMGPLGILSALAGGAGSVMGGLGGMGMKLG